MGGQPGQRGQSSADAAAGLPGRQRRWAPRALRGQRGQMATCVSCVARAPVVLRPHTTLHVLALVFTMSACMRRLRCSHSAGAGVREGAWRGGGSVASGGSKCQLAGVLWWNTGQGGRRVLKRLVGTAACGAVALQQRGTLASPPPPVPLFTTGAGQPGQLCHAGSLHVRAGRAGLQAEECEGQLWHGCFVFLCSLSTEWAGATSELRHACHAVQTKEGVVGSAALCGWSTR